ncbi:TetR/AcrR family transcriptional regulator [Mycobacterium sp.]|jgi:AcrR family transcriptional regulator|uniref:TetR/AcrR family transcriptional regulator n=1 Tax=Mycobacterium sp. TaxID=1785 RepID=UPI002D545990|nr:TetR/AcrR family transcriptional regulator [Mycobacterium sp.]HZA12291.1 TetR/AcrR family transcriptional regulator [Mycobacterium sp.]
MPRGSRSQPAASTDDARERILAAAERCIERHGIRKTTMDDVASEVGLSRPSVYRYFADRDDLLLELITRHSGALIARAHKSISRQSSLADQIVEGLLYIAEHARQDPLTRHVIDPDATSLGRRMITSGASEMCRAELWDPFIDAAVANNELPRGLSRADIHLWLGGLGTMLMRGLEDGEADVRRYRSILRRFVAPAFAGSNAQVNA